MKKILLTIILLLIIVSTFGFVFLRLSAQGPDNSFFNRKLRSDFAVNPALRNLFGLHFDGDGKADYLGGRYKKIDVEVDLAAGITVSNKGLELLRQRIEEATGKPTDLRISEIDLPYTDTVDREQIAQLVAGHRNPLVLADTASVYMLFVPRFSGEENLLGLTYQEYGVVVFESALEDFAKVNKDTLPYYQESTALHEFGHQLGLGHNEEAGCLMNEHAEKNSVARQSPADVITDFCRSEKAQIQETIRQLNN